MLESTCLVSTFGQNMPKIGQQQKNIFLHSTRANYLSVLRLQKVSPFTILLANLQAFRESGNETYNFYHLYTFQFKKA